MPRSRYPLLSPQRMVELLRSKEERRGFQGTALKGKKQRPNSPECGRREHGPVASEQPMSPEEIAIWEITRQTTRNYTPTTNSGVTRLENLRNAPGCGGQEAVPIIPEVDAPPPANRSGMAREVHRAVMTKKELVGLVECYRKVCKSNINSLQTLLPQRSPGEGGRRSDQYRYTGFTVKSYRNPNQAEIIADFPHNSPRPQTVIGSNSQRPFVPSPYFFKGYNPPKTAQGNYSQGSGGCGPGKYNQAMYSSNDEPLRPYSPPPLEQYLKSLRATISTHDITGRGKASSGAGQVDMPISCAAQDKSAQQKDLKVNNWIMA